MTRIAPLKGNINTTGSMQEGLADAFAERLLTALKAGADENGRGVFRLGGFGELVVEPTQVVYRRADARYEAMAGTPTLSLTGYRYQVYRFVDADSERITEAQALRLLVVHKQRLVTEAMADFARTLGQALDGGAS